LGARRDPSARRKREPQDADPQRVGKERRDPSLAKGTSLRMPTLTGSAYYASGCMQAIEQRITADAAGWD
jgi:hypothetical protein